MDRLPGTVKRQNLTYNPLRAEMHSLADWSGAPLSRSDEDQVTIREFKELASFDGKIKALKAELATVKSNHRVDMRDLRQRRDKAIQKIKGDYEKLKTHHRKEKATFMSNLDELKAEYNELKAECDELKAERTQPNAECTKLKAECTQLKEEYNKIKVEYYDLKKESFALKRDHDKLKEEHDELKREHGELKTRSDERIQRLETDATSGRAETNRYRSMRDDAQAKVLELEQTCLRNETDGKSLRTRLTHLEAERDSLKKDLQGRVAEKGQYDDLANDHKKLKSEHEILKASKKLLEDNLENLKAQSESRKRTRDKLNLDLDKVRVDHKNELDKVRGDYNAELAAVRVDQMTTLDAYKKIQGLHELRSNELEDRVKELRNKLLTEKNMLKNVRDELQALKMTEKDGRIENLHLQGMLKAERLGLSIKEQAYVELESELSEANGNHKHELESRQKLKKEFEVLQQDHETLVGKFKELEISQTSHNSALASREAELEKMRKELLLQRQNAIARISRVYRNAIETLFKKAKVPFQGWPEATESINDFEKELKVFLDAQFSVFAEKIEEEQDLAITTMSNLEYAYQEIEQEFTVFKREALAQRKRWEAKRQNTPPYKTHYDRQSRIFRKWLEVTQDYLRDSKDSLYRGNIIPEHRYNLLEAYIQEMEEIFNFPESTDEDLQEDTSVDDTHVANMPKGETAEPSETEEVPGREYEGESSDDLYSAPPKKKRK